MTDAERAKETMAEVYDALPADLGDTTDYEREECRGILVAAFAAVRSEALEQAARVVAHQEPIIMASDVHRLQRALARLERTR